MKPFVFSLARMRGYKEQMLEKEKNTLRRLRRARDDIEQHIRQLEQARRTREEEFAAHGQTGVDARALYAYRFYCENIHQQIKGLQADLRLAEEAVEAQRKIVLQASQEVSGLEKLEDKQREEYTYLAGKETEQEILEHVSIQLHRKQ